MPVSPEIMGKFFPLPESKEKPSFQVIEKISRNIQVVEIGGIRKYQVAWKAGTTGVEGVAPSKKGEPVMCYFDTAEQVIHQHERVLENYLGTQIPLAAGKILEIFGETQRMARISQKLSSLVQEFAIPLKPETSDRLKEKIATIKGEVGKVANEYKQKAQKELEKAFVSQDERERTQAVLEANLAILKRTEECLGIVGGTNERLRIITRKRNKWEETIAKAFYEMAQIVKDFENGVYTDHPRKIEQLARHISGESEWSLIGKLNLISGPEYWQRIQTKEVQRLKEVGDLLRRGKNEEALKILREAILKLERVVKEKEAREKIEKK